MKGNFWLLVAPNEPGKELGLIYWFIFLHLFSFPYHFFGTIFGWWGILFSISWLTLSHIIQLWCLIHQPLWIHLWLYKTLLLKKTFDFHTTPTPRQKRRFHPKTPILTLFFLTEWNVHPEEIRGWGFWSLFYKMIKRHRTATFWDNASDVNVDLKAFQIHIRKFNFPRFVENAAAASFISDICF